MPVHDWSRVEAGIFHDFHTVWIGAIRSALNEGLLPSGYYALAEQHAGQFIADILALHAETADSESFQPPPGGSAGIAVAEAPPRVQRKQLIGPAAVTRRRSLTIRHVSGHRLVALVEIVSPANKDRAQHLDEFVDKAATGLDRGVHVLLVDLFAPGTHDPDGIHGAMLRRLQRSEDLYDLPEEAPLTLASYAAGPQTEANLVHLRVGDAIPEMPLFLHPERYINVPLEPTYEAAFRGMPAFWREVLERPY